MYDSIASRSCQSTDRDPDVSKLLRQILNMICVRHDQIRINELSLFPNTVRILLVIQWNSNSTDIHDPTIPTR